MKVEYSIGDAATGLVAYSVCNAPRKIANYDTSDASKKVWLQIDSVARNAIGALARREAYTKNDFVSGTAHEIALQAGAGLLNAQSPKVLNFLRASGLDLEIICRRPPNYRAVAKRGTEIVLNKVYTPSEPTAATGS